MRHLWDGAGGEADDEDLGAPVDSLERLLEGYASDRIVHHIHPLRRCFLHAARVVFPCQM